MDLKITLNCPGCNARIKAPLELSGLRRHCPGCGTPFIVRARPLQDSDPMLVTVDHLARDNRPTR